MIKIKILNKREYNERYNEMDIYTYEDQNDEHESDTFKVEDYDQGAFAENCR